METLIKTLHEAQNLAELEAVSQAFLAYFVQANEAEKHLLGEAMRKKSNVILAQSAESIKLAKNMLSEIEAETISLEVGGKKYPLSEWLTITQYCERFGVASTSVVANWIKRGIIPTENTLLIKPLNNIRLIKAVRYMN
ncbi:MAG: hypothetical protein EAZ70_01855 [Runella slithyformis]|nr:MAG: hypothetical protein EAZ80_06120 [Runella slithyformis]TAF97346.1 MAG: hypothetical protein EAZ46_02470 [Runella sp.]TAG19834.1 MAG: hypothetical protein EAZ38_11605 [Cytophagales bacterium]TAG39085.1 MAG: hypothetical protein EAZ32_10805 [Cytophagia bacterium]TAF29456.1 MAG: hypothetical protein EAZ70_01855 [Runella slithyformis]